VPLEDKQLPWHPVVRTGKPQGLLTNEQSEGVHSTLGEVGPHQRPIQMPSHTESQPYKLLPTRTYTPATTTSAQASK
jgi:hypothetical protein